MRPVIFVCHVILMAYIKPNKLKRLRQEPKEDTWQATAMNKDVKTQNISECVPSTDPDTASTIPIGFPSG